MLALKTISYKYSTNSSLLSFGRFLPVNVENIQVVVKPVGRRSKIVILMTSSTARGVQRNARSTAVGIKNTFENVAVSSNHTDGAASAAALFTTKSKGKLRVNLKDRGHTQRGRLQKCLFCNPVHKSCSPLTNYTELIVHDVL